MVAIKLCEASYKIYFESFETVPLQCLHLGGGVSLLACILINHKHYKFTYIYIYQSSKGYKISNSSIHLNHLVYMDDVKLYGKSQQEIESLVHTVNMTFVCKLVLTNAILWPWPEVTLFSLLVYCLQGI